MNADVLLEHFHRLGDAPYAVPRLRRFVLDLAVRGKLVAPAKEDEPSAALLKRIAKDLDSRIATGEFKEPKSFVDFPIEDLPFSVPLHWGWVRLITAAEVSYGYAFDSNRFNGQRQGMPLIRIRDISKTDAEAYTDEAYDPYYVVKHGDMLIGMDGDFNIRKWKGGDALLNQRVCRIREWRHGLVDDFMTMPLQMILLHLHGSTSLTTVKHLSAKQLNGVHLPLPPLPEQHRIVAKVDELMALCDRLEAAQQEREQRRMRLTAASWQALTTESDPNAARFALVQLPVLTIRPQQIAALRQTILDLAVRGKLVVQDETDEPADVLLKRIAKEKERLVKEGDIRNPKVLAPIMPEDLSVAQAPTGWIWTRLGEVATLITKGSTPTSYGHAYTAEGVSFIKVEAISNGRLVPENVTSFISEATNEFLSRSRLAAGDVLFSIAGSIGTCAIVSEDVLPANTNQALAIIRGTQIVFSTEFLLKVLQSSVAHNVTNKARGGAMNNISLDDIQNFIVPVPPLAEQRRIVAKVERLMGLCDRLEGALARGEVVKGKALEAVLAAETRLNTQLDVATPQFAVAAEPWADYERASAGKMLSMVDRAALNAWITAASKNDPYLGRTKAEKIEHLIESHIGFDHGRRPIRDAAGPVDWKSRKDGLEPIMGLRGWANVGSMVLASGHTMFPYAAGPNVQKAIALTKNTFGAHLPELERIVSAMRPLNTHQCEVIATLYAAWNDLLRNREPSADKDIIHDVVNNWHTKKKDINPSDWDWGLKWLRSNGLVPTGQARPVLKKHSP